MLHERPAPPLAVGVRQRRRRTNQQIEPAPRQRLAQGALRRPVGTWVKLWSTYYGEHSPLDGYATAVLNGLFLLARPWAARHGQGGGYSLCDLDKPCRNARQNERMARSFCAQFDEFESSNRLGSSGVFSAGTSQFLYSAAAVRWPDSAPCSLLEIARFVRLPRARVRRALQSLVDIGEAYLTIDGAYVLLNYWHAQETPSARSKRASRGASRPVDSQHEPSGDSHEDSRADIPHDSHADSREDIPVASKAEQRVKKRSAAATAAPLATRAAEKADPELELPPPHEALVANSRAQAPGRESARALGHESSSDPMLERAGAALPRKPLAAVDERLDRLEPQSAAQGAQWLFEDGAERAPLSLEQIGQRWLHEILNTATGQPAPTEQGKWRQAYRWIGERPARERDAVAVVLRAELASSQLRPRMCHPQHLVDYWPGYLAGEPPRSGAALRAATAQSWSSAPPSREQIEAEAANVPEWLRGKAAV